MVPAPAARQPLSADAWGKLLIAASHMAPAHMFPCTVRLEVELLDAAQHTHFGGFIELEVPRRLPQREAPLLQLLADEGPAVVRAAEELQFPVTCRVTVRVQSVGVEPLGLSCHLELEGPGGPGRVVVAQ